MSESLVAATRSNESDEYGIMIDFDSAWKRAHRTGVTEDETAGRQELNDQLEADSSAREERISILQAYCELLANYLNELDKEQPSIRDLKINLRPNRKIWPSPSCKVLFLK